jgi:hypothetical protein
MEPDSDAKTGQEVERNKKRQVHRPEPTAPQRDHGDKNPYGRKPDDEDAKEFPDSTLGLNPLRILAIGCGRICHVRVGLAETARLGNFPHEDSTA